MAALREFANFITLNKANLATTYTRLLAENGEPTDAQIGSARRLITAVAEACESGTPEHFYDLFKPQANRNFAPAEPLKFPQTLLEIECLGQTLTPVVTNLEAGKFLWQMLAEARAITLYSIANGSVALPSWPATSASDKDIRTSRSKVKQRQARISKELAQEGEPEEYFLRTLIDHIPDNIYAKNADSRFILANLATVRLLGASTAEEVIGKTDFDFFPAELASQFRDDELALMRSGQPLINHEERLVDTATGEMRWILSSKIPLSDDQGKVIGLVGANRDITRRKRIEEELRYRIEFDQLITTISTQFVNLTSQDIDYGINYALQVIGEFAGVDRSYVFMYSNDDTTMDNTHEWCAPDIEPQIHKFKNFPNDVLSWSYQITKRGEVLYIPRIADLPPEASAEQAEFQSQGIQSLINVPIISGGVVVGFLGFDSVRTETPWSEESIALLKLVGEMFVSALERQGLEQRIQESLERRARQVQISTEIAQEMANIPALDDLFHRVVNTVQERFGYYHVQAYLFQEGSLVLQEGTGEAGRQMKEADYKIPLSAEQNLAVRTVWSGEPVLVSDVSQEPAWLPNPLMPETKAELAVPINLGAELLGVLEVQSDRVEGVDAEDQLLLMGLCGQIAVAINSRRVEAERKQALETLAAERNLMRTLIDNIPDFIYVKDGAGRFLLANKALANLMAVAAPENLIGKSDFDFYPLELANQYHADEQALFASGQPLIRHEEANMNHQTGERTWTVTTKVPLYDERDEVIGLVGISGDITQIKQTEAALARNLSETERRARREQTIREITERMRAATSLEALVRTTARELGERLSAGHAVVELGIEPQTETYIVPQLVK